MLMRQRKFAHLLGFKQRFGARFTVFLLFRQGKAIHFGKTILDKHFREHDRLRMIDVIGLGGLLIWSYAERFNHFSLAEDADDWLGESGDVNLLRRIDVVSAWEGAEVGIEGAVFLVEDEDVFDMMAD